MTLERIKISGLPHSETLTGTEKIPMVQTINDIPTTVETSLNEIKDFVEQSSIANPAATYADPPLTIVDNAGNADITLNLLTENMVLVHEIWRRGENDNNFSLIGEVNYRSYKDHSYAFIDTEPIPGATLYKIRSCFINGPIVESDPVVYNS